MSSLSVPPWAWALLAVLLLVMITVDLFAHRGDHVDSPNRARAWTVGWIVVALLFNGFVAIWFGAEAGEQFLAAYLLEKSLSVDNLFVFLLIFGTLGIPKQEQRRVLSWGILGALLTRGLFIAIGAAALQRWQGVTYVFGAILIFTAFKMVRSSEQKGEQRLLEWLEKKIPWTRKLDGHHFFTRQNGRRLGTPLLIALVAIELTDIVFAVDSVPAAFAVTDAPFIVYSSNVLAILGLRSLYVVLAGALAELRYLHYGLAVVLAIAGLKMILARWIHVPPLAAVAVILLVIGSVVVASVLADRRDRRERRDARPPTGDQATLPP
jgi:TerC family integral membrane protein